MRSAIVWRPGGTVDEKTIKVAVRGDHTIVVECDTDLSNPAHGAPDRKPWLLDLPDEMVVDDGLWIDVRERRVFLDDAEVLLGRKCYELLLALARDPGRCYSKDDLYADVWDYPEPYRDGKRSSRTLDSHVSRLRRCLDGRYVENVWGEGYRLLRAKELVA